MFLRGEAPLWKTKDERFVELGAGVALYFFALVSPCPARCAPGRRAQGLVWLTLVASKPCGRQGLPVGLRIPQHGGTRVGTLAGHGPGSGAATSSPRLASPQKLLFVLFVTMTVVAIPIFVLLGAGTRISPEDVDGLGVAAVSLGNAGAQAGPAAAQASDPLIRIAPFGSIPESVLRSAVAGLAVTNAAVLAAFAIIFPSLVDAAAEKASERIVAASAYSVHVSGLPPDATVAEVAEHFSTLFNLRQRAPHAGGCASKVRQHGHAYARDTRSEREEWLKRRGIRSEGGYFIRGTAERVTNVTHVLEPRGKTSQAVTGERGPGRGLMMQAVKAAVLFRHTGETGAEDDTATPGAGGGSALKGTMSFKNIRRPDGTQVLVVASGGTPSGGGGSSPQKGGGAAAPMSLSDALRLARRRAKIMPSLSAAGAQAASPRKPGSAAVSAISAFKAKTGAVSGGSTPTGASSVGLRALLRARTASGAMWTASRASGDAKPSLSPAIPEQDESEADDTEVPGSAVCGRLSAPLASPAADDSPAVRSAAKRNASRMSSLAGSASSAHGAGIVDATDRAAFDSNATQPAADATARQADEKRRNGGGSALSSLASSFGWGVGSAEAPKAEAARSASTTDDAAGEPRSTPQKTMPPASDVKAKSMWAIPVASMLLGKDGSESVASTDADGPDAAHVAGREVAEAMQAQAVDTASCVVGTWVADVELVRTNGALIRRHNALEALTKRREREAARQRMLVGRGKPKEASKAGRLVAKLDKKLAAKSRSSLPPWDAAPVAGAYVTFEHAESRERCLDSYGAYGPCCGATMPRRLKFRGKHRLWAAPAEEPNEVVWENAEVTGFGRARRQCATTCAVACLILVSFLVVLAVNTGKLAAVATLPSAALCDVEIPAMRYGSYAAVPPSGVRVVVDTSAGQPCGGDRALALRLEPPSPLASNASDPAQAAAIAKAGDARCVTGRCWSVADEYVCGTVGTASRPGQPFVASAIAHCFCRSALVSALARHGTAALDKLREELGEACDDTSAAYAVSNGLVAAASVSIVVVNVVLRSLLMRMTAMEAHRTSSSETGALSVKVFLAQFVNTAVVFLLVNAAYDVPTAAVSRLSTAVSSGGAAGSGGGVDIISVLASGFSDFSSLWYADVGFGITVAVMVSTALSHVQGGVALASWAWARRCRLSRRLFLAVEQSEVDELFAMPEFDSSSKYPVVMNVVIVALTFAAGLPVLYLVGLVFLASTYLVDRTCLLRCTSRPAPETAEPMRQLSRILPVAAALHIAVGAWMLGERSSGGQVSFERLGASDAAPMVALLALFLVAWAGATAWRAIAARALRPVPPQIPFTGMAYRELPLPPGTDEEEAREPGTVELSDPYRGKPHKILARLRNGSKTRTRRAWEVMDQGGSSYFVGASPRYGAKFRSIVRSQGMVRAADEASTRIVDEDVPPEERVSKSTGGAWTWTSAWVV